MPDKLTDVTDNNVGKMNDNEIVKALKTLLELVLVEGCLQRAKTISKALDLINRLKEENERLKANLNIELEEFASEYDNKIKASAYKECIEKVKEYIDTHEHLSCEECECVPISKDGLDNLLKELVGDDK